MFNSINKGKNFPVKKLADVVWSMVLGWARLELYWGKDGRRGQGGDLLCTFLGSKKGKRERVGKKNIVLRSWYIYIQ